MFAFISRNTTIHGQVSLFLVFSSFNATKPNLYLSKKGRCRSPLHGKPSVKLSANAWDEYLSSNTPRCKLLLGL